MKYIHECIGNIGISESTIFTTIDLTSGIWQMPLHKDSIPKTAFTLPGLGQYKWLNITNGTNWMPCKFSKTNEEIMDKLANVKV